MNKPYKKPFVGQYAFTAIMTERLSYDYDVQKWVLMPAKIDGTILYFNTKHEASMHVYNDLAEKYGV